MIDLDLDAIEREARAHQVRCQDAANRMIGRHRGSEPHPGIVPSLCETILALVGALRRERMKRGRAA